MSKQETRTADLNTVWIVMCNSKISRVFLVKEEAEAYRHKLTMKWNLTSLNRHEIY